MTGFFKRHIQRLYASSDGSVAVFVGLFLVGALGAGVMVVDYTRASTLQGKLQHAMDTSVGEAARGKTDAQVIGLAKAQIAEFLKDGKYAGVDEATFTITREDGRVTLSGSLPYSPLFGPLYGLVGPAGNLLVASGSSAREDLCKPLAAARRWSAQSGACDAGEIGSHTWEVEEERTSSCAEGASEPTWSAWLATGTIRAEVKTCAPACNPEPDQTEWLDRSQSCPSGQVGEITWQAERRRVSTCSRPTGNPSWGSWQNTGAKRAEVNTCATLCTATPLSTRWASKTAACPPMHTGQISWEQEETRSSSCPSQFASPDWTEWVATGQKRKEKTACTPVDGAQSYSGTGTYTFTVPANVTQISVLAIGAGASGQSRHGAATSAYRGFDGGASSVTGPSFVLKANGGTGHLGGCGGPKQGGGCGGNGGIGQAWTSSSFIGEAMGGGGGGAAGGLKGRGGDGSGTTVKNPGTGDAGPGGGAGGSSMLCAGGAGISVGSNGASYGGNNSGTSSAGTSSLRRAWQLDNGCGSGGTGPIYGGGGGGAAGFIGTLQSGGSYLLEPTPGRGGGGGELSYGTYDVTPGQRLTVVVGVGGGEDQSDSARDNAQLPEWPKVYGKSESGKGDGGYVRIIWGPGLSYPDNIP